MNTKESGYAIISNIIASIRTKPDAKSSLADEGLCGMIVKLIKDENNGWHYIETHYNYRGYIHESDLIIDTERALLWKDKTNHLVIHSIVDVMKEPDYKSYVIQLLTRGAHIQTTGSRKEGWAEIILPSSEKGWIKESYFIEGKRFNPKQDEAVLREKFVQTACSYIGTQYRWGGKSSLGIDCSGLCSMAYMINSIIIWRDAELREEYMKEIKREEIKKGDLLFYKGHVAMYIGNEKAVHSTSSQAGVVINSLNEQDDDYSEMLDKELISVGTIF